MEQTQDITTTYEPQAEVENVGTDVRLPKLFWAGALVFTMNVVVAGFIAVSPNLSVNMYGSQNLSLSSNSPAEKPSPFSEVVSDKPVRIKLASHMTPVLMDEPTDFQMPRATQSDLYQPAVYRYSGSNSGAPVQQSAQKSAAPNQLDIPRVTASLMPRRTESPRVSSVDVAPRRVSEHEQKPIVIN